MIFLKDFFLQIYLIFQYKQQLTFEK